MNGIVGLVTKKTSFDASSRVEAMLTAIAHRGPDRRSVTARGPVVFGACGAGTGEQPDMSAGNLLLAFDGDILNASEIRDTLARDGQTVADEADEALLLLAFQAYGLAFVKRIKGPFALAVYEKDTGTLHLARDMFGAKSLYYTRNADQSLMFASEIKAFTADPSFKKELNIDVLRPYLTFEYSPLIETFFKGVFRVKAGQCVTLTDDSIEKTSFLEIPLGVKEQSMDDVVKRIQTVLERNRPSPEMLAAEGGFLSGGVDSSYLTALYRPSMTFSVGFPGEAKNFDETTLASELSERLGIPNKTRHVSPDEVFDRFSDIQYHCDEPIANPSAVPLWFLAQHTKQYVGTAISGEGADEIFAGYHWYNKSRHQLFMERFVPSGIRRVLAKLAEKLPNNRYIGLLVKSGQPLETRFIGQSKIFESDEVGDVLLDKHMTGPTPQEVTAPYYAKTEGYDDLTRMRALDFELWSPGLIMQKADRMCMAHGLKTYMPFVDPDMLAIGMSVPRDLLIAPQQTKIALRKAAESVIPQMNTERTKLGFEVPIRVWLRREPFYSKVEAMFNSEAAAAFFKTDELNRLLRTHKNETQNNARKIWAVYAFLTWYERYFGTPDGQATRTPDSAG